MEVPRRKSLVNCRCRGRRRPDGRRLLEKRLSRRVSRAIKARSTPWAKKSTPPFSSLPFSSCRIINIYKNRFLLPRTSFGASEVFIYLLGRLFNFHSFSSRKNGLGFFKGKWSMRLEHDGCLNKFLFIYFFLIRKHCRLLNERNSYWFKKEYFVRTIHILSVILIVTKNDYPSKYSNIFLPPPRNSIFAILLQPVCNAYTFSIFLKIFEISLRLNLGIGNCD